MKRKCFLRNKADPLCGGPLSGHQHVATCVQGQRREPSAPCPTATLRVPESLWRGGVSPGGNTQHLQKTPTDWMRTPGQHSPPPGLTLSHSWGQPGGAAGAEARPHSQQPPGM